MCFETLFFDLDDTLYPPTSGLWNAIGERIETFMREYVQIPAAEVRDLRTALFLEHGSTMKGLVKLYGIQEQAFLYIVVHRLHRNARLELLALLLCVPKHCRWAALFVEDRGFNVVCKFVILADFQSWAFVHFLMERYPEQFQAYIRDVMRMGKDHDAPKDIALLEKHVGKPLKALDLEQEGYIRDIMGSKLDKDEYDFYRLLQKA